MTARADDNDLEVLLLERYCSGMASPDETAQIDVWFKKHPDQRLWYEQLRAELRKDSFTPMSAEEHHAAWSEVIRMMLQRCPDTEAQLMSMVQSANVTAVPAPPNSSENLLRQRTSLTYALRRVTQEQGGSYGRTVWRKALYGSIAVAMAITLVFAGRHSVSSSKNSVTTYATRSGERADITLPDGS
jgi:ferric-dicitrate binding protein FerR (iron transport regulator)